MQVDGTMVVREHWGVSMLLMAIKMNVMQVDGTMVVREHWGVSMLLMAVPAGASCSLSLLTFFCVLLALKQIKRYD